MSANARLADVLLREHGGLYEWCMNERRGVSPKTWDQVAQELEKATEGQVRVGGRVVRQWCSVIEASKDAESVR